MGSHVHCQGNVKGFIYVMLATFTFPFSLCEVMAATLLQISLDLNHCWKHLG